MRKTTVLRCGFVIAVVSAMPCGAAIVISTAPGAGPPPATLGGFNMFAFPTDARSEFTVTNFAPFAAGNTLGFSADLEIYKTPGSWATWNHGYSGTVYFNDPFVTNTDSITLTFPTSLKAFYMYVQPNLLLDHEFKFESGGTDVTLMINGSGGAHYIGVYNDDPLGSLGSMLITQTGGTAEGFAIGEFASNGIIPEPAQVAGLGLLLVSGVLLRNRRPV